MHKVVLPAFALGLMMVSAIAVAPSHAANDGSKPAVEIDLNALERNGPNRDGIVVPIEKKTSGETRLRKPVLTAPLLGDAPPPAPKKVNLPTMPEPKPATVKRTPTQPQTLPVKPVEEVRATPPGQTPSKAPNQIIDTIPQASREKISRPALVVLDQEKDGPIQHFKVTGSVRPMINVTRTVRDKNTGDIIERETNKPNVAQIARAPRPTPTAVKPAPAPVRPVPQKQPVTTAEQNSLLSMMAPQRGTPQPKASVKKPSLVVMDTPPVKPAAVAVKKPAAPKAPVAHKTPQKKPALIKASAPATKPPVVPKAAAAKPQKTVITFDGDSSELNDRSRKSLKGVADILNKNGDLQLQLLGYAGGIDGSQSSARSMSLSRALAVRKFLIDHGIRPTRVEVRALGSQTDASPVDRVDLLYKN